MESIVLSKRLEAITQYISPYKYIADIGTDHCFVPISLCQEKIIEGAIATDLRDGPIEEAKKNVKIYQLDDKIQVRQGNGLSPLTIDDNIDVVIIAGMGGRLMGDILERDAKRLTQVKRYILQPNKSTWFVRKWFYTNGFKIIDEAIVEDEGIIYEIIVAEPAETPITYHEYDLMFGPILRHRKDPLFIVYWANQLNHKQQILSNLRGDHPDRRRLISEITKIKEVLGNSE